MHRPVIGVFASAIPNTHPLFAGGKLSALSVAYTNAVIKCGGCPIVIPYSMDYEVLQQTLALCDGVIFPGGVDIAPSFYHEEPHACLGRTDPILDEIQLKAFEYLKDVPVLGICRGYQLMNVFLGGTLYQDISSSYEGDAVSHVQKTQSDIPAHNVCLKQGSRIIAIMGVDAACVNSIHHQAIKRLGSNLTAVAAAADGIIEAIEHDNNPWLAVQWHPEELTHIESMRRLFEWLIDKAREDRAAAIQNEDS